MSTKIRTIKVKVEIRIEKCDFCKFSEEILNPLVYKRFYRQCRICSRRICNKCIKYGLTVPSTLRVCSFVDDIVSSLCPSCYKSSTKFIKRLNILRLKYCQDIQEVEDEWMEISKFGDKKRHLRTDKFLLVPFKEQHVP